MLELPQEQKEILLHTLGVNAHNRQFYRNHFVCGDNDGIEQRAIHSLVSEGLMRQVEAPGFLAKGDRVFSVTESGKHLVVSLLSEHDRIEQTKSKAKQRYHSYLRSDSGDDFANFLGIVKPVFSYRNGLWQCERVKFNGGFYPERVCGEWCHTKREAKESYKAALKVATRKTSTHSIV